MAGGKKKNRKGGFTLVELIVVVSLIGIIAAIALKQMGQTQVKAYVSSMKADLRNFALAEESYFYDNGMYASNASMVGDAFIATPGVTITINEATKSGWSATTTHPRTSIKCYLFSEFAAPIGAATEAGTLVCT